MNVQYSVETQTVTFQSPTNDDLCVQVRLLSADKSWTSQLDCSVAAVRDGSVKLQDGAVDNVKAVEVSFCNYRRMDICGQPLNATIGQCAIQSQPATVFRLLCFFCIA